MNDVVMAGFGSGSGSGSGSGPGSDPGSGPGPNTSRKRKRIRFSCNHCRDKKLKCNRVLPCDQCLKRSLGAVCRYVPYMSYPTSHGQSAQRAQEASTSGGSHTHGQKPSLKRQHSMMDPVFDLEQRVYETSSAASTAGTSRSGSVVGEQQPPTPLYNQQPFSDNPFQQSRQQKQYPHQQHAPRLHLQEHQQPRSQPQQRQQSHFPPLTPPPPILHDTSSQSVPKRLKYLEQLVMFLTARNRDPQHHSPGSQSTDDDIDVDVDGSEHDDDDNDVSSTESTRSTSSHSILDPGGEINVAEFRYADPSNWEGVLDDIVGLTRDLVLVDDAVVLPSGWDFGQTSASTATNVSAASGANTLALFVGYNGLAPASTDMLRFLPPRPVVDLLVNSFFDSLRDKADPHALHLLFHPPSFQRQYAVFWSDPRGASLSYLALLFSMVAHAAMACLRDADERMSPARAALGDDPLVVIDACRHRAAQCLTLDDYARPGRYKVEALILYFGVEYYWRRRLQTSSSSHASPVASTAMILSLAVRLAMHMGYHRDPSHFGGRLSPFEGEMRRRVWLVLVNLDQTVCYELSLPSNVHHGSSARPGSGDSDTALPRNLYESDLSEDLPTLPPARPYFERTGVLYAVARSRLLAVLADIIQLRPMTRTTTSAAAETTNNSPDVVPGGSIAPLPTPPTSGNTPTTSSANSAAYEARVMQLDRRLTATYRNLPSCLRLRGSRGGGGAVGSASSAGSGGSRSCGSILSGETARQRAAAAIDRDPLDPRDPPDLCIERYLLEIMYQKARLLLHRRFQGTGRASPRYAYARWVCTDAAVRLLRHQYDVYVAVQPVGRPSCTTTTSERSDAGSSDWNQSARRGSVASSIGKKMSEARKDKETRGGRLAAYRWLLYDSAVTHDFLLADMVLCLEVSYATRRPTGVDGEPSVPAGRSSAEPENGAVVSLPRLLGLLKTSRSIWASLQGTSSEAARAYSVLTRVLTDAEAMKDEQSDEEEEEEDDEAERGDYHDEFEPASPAFTTSTARTARTARTGYSGMSGMSGRSVSITATTDSMQSSHSSISLTATAPTRPVPLPVAPRTTEAVETESSGTSGSTTPRYGEYKPPDPVVAQQQQQTVSTPVAPLPPPVIQVPHAPHTPQGMGHPQLASPTQWPDHTAPLLPVLLDMGMPTPVVGYGIPMQPGLSGLSGLSSNLTSGLLPTMSVPLQFPPSTNSSGLPTPADGGDDGMQGFTDTTFSGDWNTLWPDQTGGSSDQHRSSPNWNDFFAREGGMDNP